MNPRSWAGATGKMELLCTEMGTIEGEVSSGENENRNADSGMLSL